MIEIPARRSKAARLHKGQIIKLINTIGQQVVDTWAFNVEDLHEFMSMEHSRVAIGRIIPEVGDTLVTNRRRPILTVISDTSPGVHDTLMAACDRTRYELLGCKNYHRNCTDNLWEALLAVGVRPTETPCPFNLFQNTPVDPNGRIAQRPTVAKRGDRIVLRAEMDLYVCFSACPQDILPINSKRPRSAHFRIR